MTISLNNLVNLEPPSKAWSSLLHTTVSLREIVGRVVHSIVSQDGTEGVLPAAQDWVVEFRMTDGSCYRLAHSQSCCEDVLIEDIIGDMEDLIGSPLVMAEEVSNEPEPDGYEYSNDSHTWTWYKFATAKGYVTFRWLGESNGYYSEEVEFYRVENWTPGLPKAELDRIHVIADLCEARGEFEKAKRWREHAAEFTAI